MKNIFDNRWFCFGMSLACAWFMYQDFSEHSKINILNLLYFICFTFLALYRKKPTIQSSGSQTNNLHITTNKKDFLTDINEEQELKLTKTFKK